MSLLAGIIQELGVVALNKQSDGEFKLLNNQSAWFIDLLNSLDCPLSEKDKCIEHEDLCFSFPFIENFLIDAENLWGSTELQTIRSGIWTEIDPTNNEYQLEARACNIQG